MNCQPSGIHSQVLHAKFLHHSFAQNIGIEFAGLRKFDNSLGDQLIICNIAAVASPRARRVISNARPIIRLVSGSNLELPKNCEMGMEICSATPAIGGLREAAPGGRLGGIAPPGTRTASAAKP